MNLPCHEHDVVIAANVLHDARDLPRSLGYLLDFLRPGGLLLLLEATRNTPLQLVTAGLIEGFNGFDDFRAEQGMPLISPVRWRNELVAAGFAAAESLPIDHHGLDSQPGQHVIMAHAPEQIVSFGQDRFLAALGEFLPHYMLPSSITVLDSLPLSANGKVDRKRLQPTDTKAKKADRITPPKTDRELTVAEIWRKALDVDLVGRESHFFEIGGDSLIATRVAGELKRQLGRPVPMRMIFEKPVLSEFAASLASTDNQQPWPTHLMLRNGGAGTEVNLILLPGSDGMGLSYRNLAEIMPEAFTVTALQTPGMGKDEAPVGDLKMLANVMADRVVMMANRRRIVLGGWSFGALLAAETAAQLTKRGVEPEALLLIDAPPDPAKMIIDPAEAIREISAQLTGEQAAALGSDSFWSAVAGNFGFDRETSGGLGLRFDVMVAAHREAMRTHFPNFLGKLEAWLSLSVKAARRMIAPCCSCQVAWTMSSLCLVVSMRRSLPSRSICPDRPESPACWPRSIRLLGTVYQRSS